jgi:hypothetical protein
VVIGLPDGSRTSAACGAVRAAGARAPAAFAPSTTYDGATQTTFIYAAVPPTVARVSLDLNGRGRDGGITLPGAGPSHIDTVPTRVPAATKALGADTGFVVVAVPGDQRIQSSQAFDASGRVLSHCDDNGGCTSGG